MKKRQVRTRKQNLRVGINTSTGETFLTSVEIMNQMIQEGKEAQPLLSEAEMLKTLMNILKLVQPAVKIRKLEDPLKYRGFSYQELHEIVHVFALALMLYYHQPCYNALLDDRNTICALIQELGL